MMHAIHEALEKVATAANTYDEATQNAATMAAESATAADNAHTAAEEAEEARQLEAAELEALRTAVDELDAILTPPKTTRHKTMPRTA